MLFTTNEATIVGVMQFREIPVLVYQWRSKFGGMYASMMKRLKELEDENRRLKKMYADERPNKANGGFPPKQMLTAA